MDAHDNQIAAQALPADLQAILNELGRTDQEARQLVAELSEAQLNWRPGGSTQWSVAQCLDHLGQINSVYVAALRSALGEANPRADARRNPIRPGWFGRWFISQMEPPPRRKLKSPKPGVPVAHKSGAEVLENFLAVHQELRSLVREARDLDLNRVRFRNPFVGVIRFPVGTGLLIIGAHDRRHLWQANQVRAAMQK
jgi:DinB superfamily